MTYSFSDGGYDYHVTAGLSGPDGARAAGAPEVAALLRSSDHAAGVRRLLYDLEPVALLPRVSDLEAADRLARHVETGRARVWRVRSRRWDRADVGRPVEAAPGALEDAALEGGPPAAPAALEAVEDAAPPRCSEAWAEIDAEVEAVLARGGDADPVERNRHVTAAYAQYYRRTQARGVDNPWAGVAAIVSGQAGCSMVYADQMIEMGEDFDRAGDIGPGPGLPLETAGLGYQEVGKLVERGLADTNKYIFEDIYPVLRMHEEHGMSGVERCGPVRPSPPGPVSRDVRNALRLIDQGGTGNVREAGRLLARHEQSTIVQDKILTDLPTRVAFWTNQAAAETDLGQALGARKPELALTADCPPYTDGVEAVPFRGSFTQTRNRVRYYQDLARAFGQMPAAEKARTLGTLARGGA